MSAEIVEDLLVSCDQLRFAATANTKSRVRAAIAFGHLPAQSHTIKPLGAIDDYLETQKATANTQIERLNSTENVAPEAFQTVAAPRGRCEEADGVWRQTCRPPLVTLEEQQPLSRTADQSRVGPRRLRRNPRRQYVNRGVEVKHVRDEQTRDPAERFCLRASRSHKLAIA
jgi:hypothetical protein